MIVRETDKEIDEKYEHIKQTVYGIVNMLIRDEETTQTENASITVLE